MREPASRTSAENLSDRTGPYSPSLSITSALGVPPAALTSSSSLTTRFSMVVVLPEPTPPKTTRPLLMRSQALSLSSRPPGLTSPRSTVGPDDSPRLQDSRMSRSSSSAL